MGWDIVGRKRKEGCSLAYAIDALMIAVVIFLIAVGAKRGLIKSLFGFLGVILALVGALWAVRHLAPYLASYLTHGVEQRVTQQLTESVQNASDPALRVDEMLPDILRGFGFYEKASENLLQLIREAIAAATEELVPAAAHATAVQVSNAAANVIVFILAFVLLLLVLWLFSRLLDLVAKLPGLKQCNALGGAIFGGLKALLLLLVFAWVVRYLGVIVPQSLVEETVLLRFFVNLI